MGERLSRRDFLKRAGQIGAETMAAIAGLEVISQASTPEGISFRGRRQLYSRLNVSNEEAEFISSFRPITIAHRAGNTLRGITDAKSSNIDCVEVDVNKAGGHLYAEHGEIIMLGRLPLGVFDEESARFKFGRPAQIEMSLQTIGQAGMGVMFDLKRGSLHEGDIYYLRELCDKSSIDPMVHSNNPYLVDTARRVFDENKCYYVPANNTDEEWNYITQRGVKGIFSNAQSIISRAPYLRNQDIKVIAGLITDPKQIREMAALGIKLAGVFSEKKDLSGFATQLKQMY